MKKELASLKRKKKTELLKLLPKYVESNRVVKKVNRPNTIPFRVTIKVNEINKKKDGSSWTSTNTINQFDNEPLVFRGVDAESIRPDVESYVNSIYPIDNSGFITEVESIDYRASLPPKKTSVNPMNIPMRLSLPYKLCFLKHFNNIDNYSYENHGGECVPKTLSKHLGITLKHILSCFDEISMQLYNRKYKKKHGITSEMLLKFCKSKNISILGFNDADKVFVKCAYDAKRKQKYKSIIYYMAMGHFYIITDEKIVRHLSQSHKNGICFAVTDTNKEIKEEESQLFFNLSLQECKNLPPNSINILEEKHLDLDAYLYECIEEKMLVDVKYRSISIPSQITLNLGKDHKVKIVVAESRLNHLTTQHAQIVCQKLGLPFKNQSIGTLLMEIQKQFYAPKREQISDNLRTQIIREQRGLCQLCKTQMSKIEIDHIVPVCSGGLTEYKNLQALCPECHREKTDDEHSDYFPKFDFTSSLNIQAYQILKSKFSRKVAFNHYFDEILDNLQQIKQSSRNNVPGNSRIKCLDINKCRRNIWLYGKYSFPVYSVLDNWEKFDGKIEDGNYYVETEQYFPFRGNGIYNRALVEFGIENRLISKSNIKMQFKSSITLKDDYFKPFVNHLLNVFDFDKTCQKLAPNSWIGCQGSRFKTIIKSKFCKSDDKETMGLIHQDFKNPYINSITNDVNIITDEVSVDNLETNFYIHSHILDIEAMEAYKMYQLILSKNCTPLCVKTDAIIYLDNSSMNNAINPNDYFFNPNVVKYKHEEDIKWLAKPVHKMESTKLRFGNSIYKYYSNDEVYSDFTYDNIAEKIIQSEKGCLCLGSAGTGKSTLINKIAKRLEEMEKKFVRLAPTNKSAHIINGETLDKFCHATLTTFKSINKAKKYDYIFVDEISMVRESFYKVLLMLKHCNPDIKFIICGDFYQLPPVLDRITNRSYENSRVLFELVDGTRLFLNECKRSDDELFSLCETVKRGDKIDISQFQNNAVNLLNICFTNDYRKIINKRVMNLYLSSAQDKEQHKIEKLGYDENSQSYTLCEGMPLIARKNSKADGIINTEIFTCKGFNGENALLSNEATVGSSREKENIEIPISRINRLFHLAFAITTHKSQGATFENPYTIHEWSKMDKKLKYVALSRATNVKNISIKL